MTFCEYEAVGGAEGLRQGDILAATDPEVSKWARHLFVITADCDFAHQKNHGRVTCVPLLTADEYLLEMHLPRIRDRLVKIPLTELLAALRASGASRVTAVRARQWASDDNPEDALALAGLADDQRERALNAIQRIRIIDSPVSTVGGAVDALARAQSLTASPPKRETAIGAVVGPLCDAYAGPPGDALFLSAIAPGLAGGYFAYLRHIEQVWESDVATTPTRRDVAYRRISRLKERYAYAIVQRFALVFMSIGLPPEYEDERALHAQLLREGSQ